MTIYIPTRRVCVRRGWTERLDFELGTADGPADLTGAVVTLRLFSGATAVDRTAEIVDGPAGVVRWSPDPSDTAARGVFGIRFRVVGNAGDVSFYPSGEDVIQLHVT